MKCRCTMTVPQCNLGHLLFTELIQVQGLWSTAFEEKKKEMWQRYIQAHHAYRRHIEGWHDNDIRVERVMGGWEIKHLDGKPLLYFRAAEEAHLQQWFVEQGSVDMRCSERTSYRISILVTTGSHIRLPRLTPNETLRL